MRTFPVLAVVLLTVCIPRLTAQQLQQQPGRSPEGGSPEDSLTETAAAPPIAVGSRSPTGALLRSAVLPGWGQFYNDEPVKGMVYGCVELGLLTWLLIENSAAEDARLAGDDDDYQVHRQRRLDLIWYTSASWLLGMLDAYVDAHLFSFRAENEEFEREVALGLGVSVRF